MDSRRIKQLISKSFEVILFFLKKKFPDKNNFSASITIRFNDKKESKKLNNIYRKKNYPTNVLTFTYQGLPKIVSDIVICSPLVLIESEQRQIKIEHHISHLIVHGILHSFGFTHQNKDQAKIMESLEIIILRRFGISNPYMNKRFFKYKLKKMWQNKDPYITHANA